MSAELPRVLTAASARALDVSRATTRHRVERGRWWRLAHDLVLTAPGPPSRDDWIHAGLVLGGPRAAAPGASTAGASTAGASTAGARPPRAVPL